jgi:L,D-transpeptidase YcbB
MQYPFRAGALVFFVLIIVSHCSCTGQSGKDTPNTNADSIPVRQKADVSLPGSFNPQAGKSFDSGAVNRFFKNFPTLAAYQQQVSNFYSKRNHTLAWYDANGLSERGGNLYNKLLNLDAEGLAANLQYADTLQQMVANTSSEANAALCDIMLTSQYFFYASQVWTGLGAKGMQAVNWDLPQKKLSYQAMLDSLLEAPASAFMQNEPIYRQYALLKAQLKKYRDIEKAGGWPTIKADKKSYKKGDSSLTIIGIKKRLWLTGDLAANNDEPLFDDALEIAVKNFQLRYGLTATGTVDARLITEMNTPIKNRIRQLIVNMERCRWLPLALNKDYLVVNIPEYRLHVFEKDSLAWSMNVVVGTSMNKTAIFSGMMNTVVFSPYWNVPPGIMKNETLPAIKRDKNYLQRNHMEWNGNAVRQIPGPWNALGKVKFLFPNSHNIYLHDTPAKTGFEKDRRAFSHGCIRVAEPQKLANYILRKQAEWQPARIATAMNAGKEQYVKINEPLPVLITYLTAWVDAKGLLQFRPDVYNRDERLAKIMMEGN